MSSTEELLNKAALARHYAYLPCSGFKLRKPIAKANACWIPIRQIMAEILTSAFATFRKSNA
ncbi:MAG: hypothetical protein AAFR27_15335 [Pseudomonadota bacterium]